MELETFGTKKWNQKDLESKSFETKKIWHQKDLAPKRLSKNRL